MIEYTLSEDCKTILSLSGYGELVVPSTVERLGCEIKDRNQISQNSVLGGLHKNWAGMEH